MSNRKKILFLSLVVAALGAVLPALAADDAPREVMGRIAELEQQLNAKQMEVDALYAAAAPDAARAQGLFREMGELQGKLFAAEAELREKAGAAAYGPNAMPYAGMHHPGEFTSYGCGGRGMGRGGYGHHGRW